MKNRRMMLLENGFGMLGLAEDMLNPVQQAQMPFWKTLLIGDENVRFGEGAPRREYPFHENIHIVFGLLRQQPLPPGNSPRMTLQHLMTIPFQHLLAEVHILIQADAIGACNQVDLHAHYGLSDAAW